jgi:hypothetical protein
MPEKKKDKFYILNREDICMPLK